MALSDGDYGGAFQTSDFLDPAMGRIFAENPEALIPHLVQAGITPDQFSKSLAENFGPRFDASFPNMSPEQAQTPFIPPSGTLGGNALSFAPEQNSPMFPPPIVPPRGSPTAAGVIEDLKNTFRPPGLEEAAAPPGKAQDRVAPSEPGRVPPEALGRSAIAGNTPDILAPLVPGAAAPPEDNTEGSYTPSTQYANVADEGGTPSGTTAALPQSDPRKAEAAKSTDAARVISALSGVKAPPAPPQPQLRPFAGERSAGVPTSSPIAVMLAQVLAGNPQAQALRLGQAIGR